MVHLDARNPHVGGVQTGSPPVVCLQFGHLQLESLVYAKFEVHWWC